MAETTQTPIQMDLASPTLHQGGHEVQAFGTLRRLPLSLRDAARTQSCELLNTVLADTVILYNLYKKHHWLIAGPTFYQLHLLFDAHAAEQLTLIDVLAERVQSLGGIAVSDPRHVAELTNITRPPNGAEAAPAMLSRLMEAHQIVIEGTRHGIEVTDENGDAGSNDLLTGDVLRTNEKQLWFVSAHLVDVPLR
jgi:starvation-inducible DNA-binding protein